MNNPSPHKVRVPWVAWGSKALDCDVLRRRLDGRRIEKLRVYLGEYFEGPLSGERL